LGTEFKKLGCQPKNRGWLYFYFIFLNNLNARADLGSSWADFSTFKEVSNRFGQVLEK
jgi:hypothetical protein